VRIGTTERWTMRGMLEGSTVAEITTAIQTLEAAYSTNGRDLILYQSDGTTETAHKILSAQTMGGTRVTKLPSYPSGEGAEYATFRRYEIVVEADYAVWDQNLVAWIETVSYRGRGGEVWRLMPVLVGPWPRQTLHTNSPYSAVQRGRAVGQFSYPVAPPPLWPLDEHRDAGGGEYSGPRRHGNTFTDYETTWEYTFESNNPLVGFPTAF
jgi:hypothetical protein